ncbi:hypothetical protein NCAS_0C02580 [Naumovozyma castellii]|uniref:Sodium/calcium exchanger membrane region domain-containing protein n=1 Tax=Naumovozyma castellii TaxID=27288 RepID=G0VCN8_NAUCA|nr:hypothetical protein NCAS_0C02580 [Naumovozyma castellii CBS 4309]CCC69248.1 hypothetical protein NCAS_0C02580 [Naumovozyma castellii CBS 4309]
MNKFQRWLFVIGIYTTNITIFIISWRFRLHFTNLWEFYVSPLILIASFIILGLVTADFLTPSLSHISRDILHISDRISGMTLLALGNAIPDITSTYQSMNSHVTALALGELVGGIFFLLTVVIGSMGLVGNKIHVCSSKSEINVERGIDINSTQKCDQEKHELISYDRTNYVQDLAVFIIMIIICCAFLYNEELEFWECVTMVIFYCLYVIRLVFMHKSAMKLLPSLNFDSSSSHDLTPNQSGHERNMSRFVQGIQQRRSDLKKRIRKQIRSTYHGWVKMSLDDCLQVWENERLSNKKPLISDTVVGSEVEDEDENALATDGERVGLQRRTVSYQEPVAQSRKLDSPHVIIPSRPEEQDVLSSTVSNKSEPPKYLNLPKTRPPAHKFPSSDHIPDLCTNYYGAIDPQDAVTGNAPTSPLASSVMSTEIISNLSRVSKLHYYLVSDECTSSVYFSNSEFFTLVFVTPISLYLHLLIPLREVTYSGLIPDIPMDILQLFQLSMSPIVSSYFVSEEVPILAIVSSIFVSIILIWRWKYGIVKYNSEIISIMGFIMSLVTISYQVHLVVQTLTKWVEMFHISESILGLTIFAWGNSIGDLISNVTFVKIGIVDIALGACFGSPLLSFLFGIGFDGILIMLKRYYRSDDNLSFWKYKIEFDADYNLFFSCLGIVIAFLILSIGVPLNNWTIDRKISTLLILLYCVVLVINIYVEINS